MILDMQSKAIATANADVRARVSRRRCRACDRLTIIGSLSTGRKEEKGWPLSEGVWAKPRALLSRRF
jgi:hypothetical protein